MKIHVLAELRQPIGSTSSFEITDSLLRGDDLVLDDVRGTASTVRTDRGLLLTVSADVRIHEQCSRCLQPIETQLHVEFTEEYLPVIDADTGAPLPVSGHADEFRIGKDFFLDLSEGLRQYTLMSEPAKPLCMPECKGLCPECGADWNNRPCSCTRRQDARWEPLAALTQKHEGR